jgi:hypothetical protein
MTLAELIYRNYCESDAPSSEPLIAAWCAYEDKHGEIESASLVDNLVFAAIQHAIAEYENYEKGVDYDEV